MKARVSMQLVLLGLLGVFSFALVPAASAQPGEFVNGVLQPLADGFPKRAITLICADEPGSRDGITIRAMQQALRGISPVPILVSDEPLAQGGGFHKAKDLLDREGTIEGYYPQARTVSGEAQDLLCEPITQETGLDISDMNLVIVQETIPYVLCQRKNAPWGRTFAELVKYGKANPGKLKYISNGVGSGNDIATSWILVSFKLQVKKMPQQNAGATLSVIGAGEGDFALATAFAVQPHWQAGRVDPVLVTGPSVPPPWDKDPNVVTMVQAGLPLVPMGIVAGFSVPKQTPQSHVDWLFKLFKAGASADAYKMREKTIFGCTIDILPPKEANELKMKIYAESEPVIRAIGLHWDQQK